MEINKLNVYAGKKQILNDLSVKISNGKIIALLGKNGSGKTTLLKTISKLIKIRSGEVIISQRNINDYSFKEYAKLVTYLPQFLPSDIMPVKELVSLGLFPYQTLGKKLTLEEENRVIETIKKVGLIDKINNPICHLSGGEKTLAYLAMTLIRDTEYVFLDEPYASLDLLAKEKLSLLIKHLKSQGKTIILSSHDIITSLEIADEILLLDQGRMVSYSSKDEFIYSKKCQEVFHSEIILTKDDKGNSYYVLNKTS